MLVLLKDVILKSCVWRAGRKAIILRNLATDLFLVVASVFEPREAVSWIKPVFESDIVPILCSNLDDDEQSTRQNCISIVQFILQVPVWNAETFKKLYPEMLKRMDDAKDSVRIQAASTWTEVFPSIKVWMDGLLYLRADLSKDDKQRLTIIKDGVVVELGLDSGHYETIIDGLLIHMDDTNQVIQEAVLAALLAGRKSELLTDEMLGVRVQLAKSKHRSSMYLDQLI